MPERKGRDLEGLLNFIANAPENQEIIDMDCNEHCEELAVLAEEVAKGADLNEILPELEKHMQYWSDCREEFMALVAVIRAEMSDELPDLPPLEDSEQ